MGKKVQLKDITLKIGSGVTPKGGASVYIPKGTSLIRSQNIYNGSFSDDGLVFITDDQADKMKLVDVGEDDVLINITGDSVARCCRVKGEFLPARVNQHVCIIRPDGRFVDSRFLMYQLTSPIGQNTLLSIATGAGATRNSLTKRQLEEFEIDLPPVPIQHRIATILGAYDDLIENNLRRVKLLEDVARCEYRRVVENNSCKRVQLSEVAGVNQASLHSKFEGSIKYIDIASVTVGAISDLQEYNFKEAPGRARRIVKDGDIIWSCVRPNRKSYAYIATPEENTIASTGFAVITSQSVPSSFLYQSLITDEYVKYLESHATGAAYPAVTAKDFEASTIRVPDDRNILKAFHIKVSPYYTLINRLQSQNTQLRQTRDILLPKLMSGEIEVGGDITAGTLLEMPNIETMAAENEAPYSKPRNGRRHLTAN